MYESLFQTHQTNGVKPQTTYLTCHATSITPPPLSCGPMIYDLILMMFAGSRRVLATAVDDWSGKPYCVSS
jgi:hypothetical protein